MLKNEMNRMNRIKKFTRQKKNKKEEFCMLSLGTRWGLCVVA